MKKIIIAILLLIPLIVILTISASGMIISAEVAIQIENFELWHKGEHVTEATINLGEYRKKNLRYQLIPRYYPGVAQVSGFKWSSDNPAVATVDEDGIVTFHECGFAKVTAVSMDSVTVRSSCAFFVEDDEIHSLSCYSGGETALNDLSMQVYDARQVRVEVTPYSALVGDLEWSSSDPTVVDCTSSGVLIAKKEGSVEIHVRASSKIGKTAETVLPVTVEGTSAVKQKDVYLYGDDMVSLAPYLTTGDMSVDLSTIPMGEARSYTAFGKEIRVHRLAYQNTLGIKNLDLIKENEWKDGVFLGAGRSVTLEAVDLATMTPVEDVSIAVSDGAVLSQNGNKFTAQSVGAATVTFSKVGYESCSLAINVEIPVSYFALNVDSENDVVGLGSDRVYGNKSVYDGVITEGIRIQTQNVYPETGSRGLFSYAVEEDYASVDQNGVLTFSDEAVGRSVHLTVKSLFSTNNMTRTYEFRNIVNGINVGFGFGGNNFNAEKGEQPSYTPYYDALLVQSEDKHVALVFQTNLYMPSRETLDKYSGPYGKIRLNRDLYGNGHKLDGQFYQYDYESHVFEGTDDSQVEDWQTEITVRDLFINSYAPVGDDSKKTFEELMVKGGEPIRSFFKQRKDFKIAFRFCVFQYSYSHACLIGGTFEFDGCIFRNSAGVALMIQSLHEQENYVTINNCIFSNSISMTGIVSNGTFPLPKGEEIRYNEVRWTGDNYIYNWKKTDEIKLDIIPKGLLKNDAMDVVLEAVNDKLTNCARNSFRGGKNKGMIVPYEKEDYVNMGILFINFWSPDKTIVNGERERVTDGLKLDINLERAAFLRMELDTTELGAIKNSVKRLLDLDAPTYLLTNKKQDGSYTTAPGETYKLDESTYAKVRGQAK